MTTPITQTRPPLQIVDRALEYLLSCYEKRGDLLPLVEAVEIEVDSFELVEVQS
jgi:NADPH-dependent 7-cyano-7-deazaguanine reductase QueF-like protein